MLTATQVCKHLGISRETLRKLINTGQITAMRTGAAPRAHLRFSEEAVSEFAARNKVEPRQQAGATP